MHPRVVKIPTSLDLVNSLNFSRELAELAPAEAYRFDFGAVKFFEPFGILLVSSEMARLKRRYPESTFSCFDYKRLGYAAHMGFFKSFGLDFGKNPGEANGGSAYIPLTLLGCERIKDTAATLGNDPGDVLEDEAGNLASMLCKSGSGAAFDALRYSIREIMRNVVEHSQGTQIAFCAQYWEQKNRVEVVIADRGVGLRETLRHNPHLSVLNDKAALNYALMPAVSGKVFKGSRDRKKGHWRNSGFGLYMTSRICRNGGTFFIGSGDTGMLLTKAVQGKTYFPCSFAGTIVRMVIKTDQVGELAKSLNAYRRDGYEIQKQYAEIVDIDPSAASLMLSEDFDLGVWKRLLATVGIGKSRKEE